MIKLDIRTKVCILLTISICTFIVNTIWIEAVFMLAVGGLQILSGEKVFCRGLFVTYFIFLCIGTFVLPILPELVDASLSVIVVQVRSTLPLLMAIFLIVRTTKVSELIATMTKMRVPKPATITLAVTLRYFPAIVEEWAHIREAMKLRPVAAIYKNPLKKMAVKVECYVIPLFIAASKTADELTSAAITRGIENPAPATCRGYHHFGKIDFLFIVICLLTIVVSAIAKGV